MSRIGRAIIEIGFKGDQAKSGLSSAKTDLSGIEVAAKNASAQISKLGVAMRMLPRLDLRTSGQRAFSEGANAGERDAASVANRMSTAAGTALSDGARAGADSAIGEMKRVGQAANLLAKGLGALVVVNLAERLATGIDAFINRAETAKQRTDSVTAGVRTLRDELAKRATLNIDTTQAKKNIDEVSSMLTAGFRTGGEEGVNAILNLSLWDKLTDAMRFTTNAKDIAADATNQANAAAASAGRAKKKIVAEGKADDQKAADDLAKEADRRLEDLTAKNKGRLAEIDLEERRQLEQLSEERKKAKTIEHQNTLAVMGLEVQYAAKAARVQIADEKREKEKAAKESAAAAAAAMESAFERVAERFRDQLVSAVQSALSAQQATANSSLSQLTATVGNIASIVQVRLRANGVNLSGDGQPYGRL